MCQQVKPAGEFHKMSASPDGLQNTCKSCLNNYRRERRAAKEPKEIPSAGAKECSTCHEVKPVVEFNKSVEAPDGLQYTCRACMAKVKNRKHYKAGQKKYHRQRREILKAEEMAEKIAALQERVRHLLPRQRVAHMVKLIAEEPRTWTKANLASLYNVSRDTIKDDLKDIRAADYDLRYDAQYRYYFISF